jgi:hypothetical protein
VREDLAGEVETGEEEGEPNEEIARLPRRDRLVEKARAEDAEAETDHPEKRVERTFHDADLLSPRAGP